MTEPDSNIILFAKRLEDAPRYLLDFFFGLLAGVISDIFTTALVIAAVFLGLALDNWWWAGLFFFGAYTLINVLNRVANAIGVGGVTISRSVDNLSSSVATITEPKSLTIAPSGDMSRIPVTLPPQ